MPKRMSATAREAIMTEDRSKLDLKRSVWNDTGFVNVIKVGDKSAIGPNFVGFVPHPGTTLK